MEEKRSDLSRYPYVKFPRLAPYTFMIAPLMERVVRSNLVSPQG
jgi:hypothetical protein